MTGPATRGLALLALAAACLTSGSSCEPPSDPHTPTTPPPSAGADAWGGVTTDLQVEDGVLSWEPTDGADHYLVTVVAGEQMWLWEGPGSHVPVEDVTGGPFPQGACWVVLASAGQELLSASGSTCDSTTGE